MINSITNNINNIIFSDEIVVGNIKLYKILKYKNIFITDIELFYSYLDYIDIKCFSNTTSELQKKFIEIEKKINYKNEIKTEIGNINILDEKLHTKIEDSYYINKNSIFKSPISTGKLYMNKNGNYKLLDGKFNYNSTYIYVKNLFDYKFIELNLNKLYYFRNPYQDFRYTFYNNDNILIVNNKGIIYTNNIYNYYLRITIGNSKFYLHRIVEFLNNQKLKNIIKENLNVTDRISNRNILYSYLYLSEEELLKLNVIKIDKLTMYGYKGFMGNITYEHNFDNLYFSLAMNKFLRKSNGTKFKILYEAYNNVVNDKYVLTYDVNKKYHKIYYNSLFSNLKIPKYTNNNTIRNINLLNESKTCYNITILNNMEIKELYYNNNLSIDNILNKFTDKEKEELEELNYLDDENLINNSLEINNISSDNSNIDNIIPTSITDSNNITSNDVDNNTDTEDSDVIDFGFM